VKLSIGTARPNHARVEAQACQWRGAVWLILYLFFILAPLFALLAGTLPPTRDFWTEFSVAIGYAGLAMMGLQFGITARFRYVTEPWGEDVIYHFHRQISLLAVGLVVAHPLILFAVRPELLALQFHPGAVARPLRCPVDLLVSRAGGNGPVAREVEYQL
jgi:predicted ferric reductase